MARQITAAEFGGLIEAGDILPGDAVVYWRRSPSLLARVIRRVQRRALLDLDGIGTGIQWLADSGLEPHQCDGLFSRAAWQGVRRVRVIDDHAKFSHAGMILDPERTVEMTSPRARTAPWRRACRPGDWLAIVRPVSLDEAALRERLAAAAQWAAGLARQRQPYPWFELLTYWFASLPGALEAEHYAEFFRSRSRNVCSGTVWQAWVHCNAVQPVETSTGDALPESWYPARLVHDRVYLRLVELIEVVRAKGGATC